MKQHKDESVSKTERTPNEMFLSLAKQRLEELAKEAERSKFFGTICVQICYEAGRAVSLHRR